MNYEFFQNVVGRLEALQEILNELRVIMKDKIAEYTLSKEQNTIDREGTELNGSSRRSESE